jgi:hypothetical protein
MTALLQLHGRLTLAHARTSTDGVSTLHVRLQLPAPTGTKPITVRCMQVFGQGAAAAYACSMRALHLKRGSTVSVRGRAISWHRGMARLDDIDQISSAELMRPHPSQQIDA